LKLPPKREPHWQRIAKGAYVGYRAISGGGTWIARFRDDEGKQHYQALGGADDYRDADGISVFDFGQAQHKARAFFERRAREIAHDIPAGKYTVADALTDYFAARRRKGSRGVDRDTSTANARILPELGKIEVHKLTPRQIEHWQDRLASAPRIVRAKRGAVERATIPHDTEDPDAVRKRRLSSNRALTVVKAALNFAYSKGRVATDDAWRRVQPYKSVDEARIRYLTADESRRLINATEPDFRQLLRGALLTGARYGELTRMQTADFNPEAGTVTIRTSKSGKPRHIVLTAEGTQLFSTLTAGRQGRELIFRRADGKPWGRSHQGFPIQQASHRAAIAPPVTFHILRHSYASTLAMQGVPMGVIATQLGHTDTRMTEKHYAHLAPSYVADTIRAALPELGGAEKSNVIGLAKPNGS
jgi:integrase